MAGSKSRGWNIRPAVGAAHRQSFDVSRQPLRHHRDQREWGHEFIGVSAQRCRDRASRRADGLQIVQHLPGSTASDGRQRIGAGVVGRSLADRQHDRHRAIARVNPPHPVGESGCQTRRKARCWSRSGFARGRPRPPYRCTWSPVGQDDLLLVVGFGGGAGWRCGRAAGLKWRDRSKTAESRSVRERSPATHGRRRRRPPNSARTRRA